MALIRLGIVGGNFGRYGLAPAFRRDPRWNIVAISTASDESARRSAERLGIAQYYGSWSEMVGAVELDAVAIATPPSAQYEIARSCFERKIPVFAEKPLTSSVADAVSLVTLNERYQLPNMIDFIFPELETWIRARDILRQEQIGQLDRVEVNWQFKSYDNRHGIQSWKTELAHGGGALQHFGCHSLYYLEYFFGEIVSMSAQLTHQAGAPGDGDTSAALSFEFSDGLKGSMVLNSSVSSVPVHEMTVYGSHGVLKLSNRTDDPVVGFRLLLKNSGENFRELAVESSEGSEPDEDSRVRPVSILARRFADWIVDGTPCQPNFRDGLRVQRLLDAAHHEFTAN